jgi:carbamate kinase
MTKRGTVVGTAVVALGGNAIIPQGESGTYEEQRARADAMARGICELIDDGWRVVVVHGNGPQVGNLVIQQEAGRADVPEMPLVALGAMTQGHLGSLIVLALHRALRGRWPVVALVSHVTVDPRDPAFGAPSKPIGPYLSEGQAAQAATERGYAVVADSGRGYRRLVASPLPRHLLELESVRFLLDAGHVVVAAGGGGIPVRSSDDGWEGIDAVVDKDHAAAELAHQIGAEALVLVTAVEAVMVDFESASPRRLGRIDVTEAERHLVEGQFHAGSMGPKVSAATGFIRSGGRTAVITTAELAAATLRGTDEAGTRLGTRIVSSASRREGAA